MQQSRRPVTGPTNSEISAGSGLRAGIETTIVSQVLGNLAGRTMTRDDVTFNVQQGPSDVFRMAMEFQDSIVAEVMDTMNLDD